MLFQYGHKVVIAYCLENEFGESISYIDGRHVVFPEGYKCGFMNPCVFKEREYHRCFPKMHIYEYVINTTALIYDSGEVLFTPRDILSKSLMRR